MRGEGIWITKDGKYIDAPISHILTAIKNPDVFGITQEEINAIYDKYGERYYMEGKAREEVIRALLKKGFIRVRAYPNRYYTVNVEKLVDKVKRLITDWASDLAYTDQGIFNTRESDVYTPVNIVPMAGNVEKHKIKDIALGELTGEKFEYRRHYRYCIRTIKNRLAKLLK